jgi:hypothetical protein
VNTIGPKRTGKQYISLDEAELSLVFGCDTKLFLAERKSRDVPFDSARPQVFNNIVLGPKTFPTAPTLSGDGLTMIFKVQKGERIAPAGGEPKVADVIWQARRLQREADFGKPMLLNITMADGKPYWDSTHPILADKARQLFCGINRQGPSSPTDLFRLNLQDDNIYGPAMPVPGDGVNTPGFEIPAWVSPDAGTMIVIRLSSYHGAELDHVIFERDAGRGDYIRRGKFAPYGPQYRLARYWLRADGRRMYFQATDPDASPAGKNADKISEIFYADLRPKPNP